MATQWILSPEQYQSVLSSRPKQKSRDDGFLGMMYGIEFYETMKEKKMTNKEYLNKLSSEDYLEAIKELFNMPTPEERREWLDAQMLRPCPFCGSKQAVKTMREDEVTPELKEVSNAPWSYTVICDVHDGGCGSSCGYKANKTKAIELWNRRR